MIFPSPLQTLPQHIVRRIVHYVTRCSRLVFSCSTIDLNDCPELLIPLLSVCHSFRDVVYSQYSTQYSLHIGRELGSVFGEWSSWPPGLRKIGSPSFGLINELNIIVDIHSIYSGHALDTLSRSLLSGCLFPVARSLNCVFTWSPPPPGETGTNFIETEANVCAFVERVKQMVPAVDDITIRTPSNRKIGLQLAGSHFGGLVSRLYELASHASYFSTARYLPMDLQPDSMRNLVHLEYRVKSGNSSQIMQVVRQNSQTLQHLALSSQMDLHVSGLIIHDDSGSYAEYPRLTTLDLNLQTSLPRFCQPVTKGVALFPCLTRLFIWRDYPFGDDTPFRGNAASLEILRIMPGRDICDILRTFDVFTPTSHPRLQCIKIEQFPEETPSHFESSRAYLQFVLSIAPGASVRDIAGVTDTDWLPPALNLFHTSIQVLALPDTRLLLCDVISLIDSLPLLSDLYCLETGLGALAEDSALDTFSARMRSRRHPTAERFRCWHLGYRDVSNLKSAVMCVLGVALMCPNFSHVALSISIHSEFMALMEETIELESLQQYSPRLRRLLFRN